MKALMVFVFLYSLFSSALSIDSQITLPCSEDKNCIVIAYENVASNTNNQPVQTTEEPATGTKLHKQKQDGPQADKYVGMAIGVIVGLIFVVLIFTKRETPEN